MKTNHHAKKFRFATGLAAAWLILMLPVVAVAGQASSKQAESPVQKSTPALPALPDQPIPIPALSPQAGKAELLDAYYAITGGRMFEALIAQFVKPPAKMQARVADCPPAKQLMETHYQTMVLPHFRDWLDNALRPRIMQAFDEGFGEAELRAFLRFAATPNGQRHLNQIATRQGKSDVSHYPEFLQDADLRAYDRQFDALGDRVDEVLAGSQAQLMTPEFVESAKTSGERIADLVLECQAAAKH